MQFLNQLLQLLQQGVNAIFQFVRQIWGWAAEQILAVPWENLGNLPLWKIILLVLVAGAIVYLLYKSVRELIEAGQKVLAAFATLLGVLVQTLLPVLLAGITAAAGAWVVNNVTL